MIKDVVVLISVKRTFVVQCTPPRVPHMLTSVSVLRDSRLSSLFGMCSCSRLESPAQSALCVRFNIVGCSKNLLSSLSPFFSRCSTTCCD